MADEVRTSSCQCWSHVEQPGYSQCDVRKMFTGMPPKSAANASSSTGIRGDIVSKERRLLSLALHFLQLCLGRRNRVQRFDHGVGEFAGAGGPADVARQMFLLGINLLDCSTDVVGGVLLAEVTKHQDAGAQHGGWVGDVLTGDVGRGAVHGFENGALVSVIRARHQSETADERRTEIRDDVTV